MSTKSMMSWVIDALIDPTKNHITVVSASDVKKAGGIVNSEILLTYMVQKRLNASNVRVLVEEVDIWNEPGLGKKQKGYHARMVKI